MRRNKSRYVPPEIAIDLEADNVELRAALALSEGNSERRELVTQELKHRIGNLLAVVHAIARHTFKSADRASVEIFSSRLLALSEAQKLLIDAETQTTTVASVVAGALAAHSPAGDDTKRVSGPEVLLAGRRAHALTLALHELATNASKYGALSVDEGWVEITWTVDKGQFEFVWAEHNGPVVVAPTRRGFGTTLITGNMRQAFGGEVDLDFRETGVVCRLRASASERA